MSIKGTHIIQAMLVIVMLSFIAMLGLSDDNAVAIPAIPKAEGDNCVAEPDYMRKNHMVMLKHDRDLKVQDGVTDIDFSLKDCIACHVVRDDTKTPVSYESPQHFCRSCHDYAAVKVDCFTCHNSKPDDTVVLAMPNPHAKPEGKDDE